MSFIRTFVYQFLRATTGVLVVLFVFYICAPIKFQYMFTYSNQILTMMYHDADRYHIVEKLAWDMEYKLHTMEMSYNENWCKTRSPKTDKPEKVAWLTALINDNFAVGAVYMGYMLQKLSCHKKMIALVGAGVSQPSQDAMRKVGWEVRVVEPLDCNWMNRQKGVPDQNLGIPGTHMRFHAWNYTEFDKMIYLDADVVPLYNIDELFAIDAELAASYCARPGIVDPCFNAGLLVFRPSHEGYKNIMGLWSSLSVGKSCPNDQVLLWHYYADKGNWVPLPYAYNVRRHLYHPMKVYHFACCLTKKPWLVVDKPTRDTAFGFEGPFAKPEDMIVLWWKYFYQALDAHSLNTWYDNVVKII